MKHTLTTEYAKSIVIGPLIVQVIVENVVTCFCETQCIYKCCLRPYLVSSLLCELSV